MHDVKILTESFLFIPYTVVVIKYQFFFYVQREWRILLQLQASWLLRKNASRNIWLTSFLREYTRACGAFNISLFGLKTSNSLYYVYNVE